MTHFICLSLDTVTLCLWQVFDFSATKASQNKHKHKREHKREHNRKKNPTKAQQVSSSSFASFSSFSSLEWETAYDDASERYVDPKDEMLLDYTAQYTGLNLGGFVQFNLFVF